MRALLLSVLILLPVSLFAQEDKSKAGKTHKVKNEHFKIDVEVTGTVESESMSEISIDTKAWTDLKIKNIAEEGSQVKKGDTVVWLETDKIDKSIEEKSFDLKLSELSIENLKLNVGGLEQTLSLDQALAERTMKHAQEDFDYFNEVERPMSEKSAQNSLKSSQWSLENSQEELGQLEKMYNEDELTEESEAIVLKRAKRSVEQSEFWLERSQQNTKRTLETSLPRTAQEKEDALERQKLEYEKAKITLPMTLEQKKIELRKSLFGFEKQSKSLADLKADRELMEMTAPSSGIVYHGRCVRGKWSSASGTGSRELKEGSSVPAKKTFLTIVDPSNVFVRCDLDEKNLGLVQTGMKGKASLVAYPDNKFTSSVKSISYIPISAGKFDCKFSIEDQVNWMPGMSCKIKVRVYDNKNALTVPSSAVFTDDDEEFYVYVKDGESHKRTVVTKGKSHSGKTEIKSGLSEGAEILTEKP